MAELASIISHQQSVILLFERRTPPAGAGGVAALPDLDLDQSRRNFPPKIGCLRSQGSHGGSVVMGMPPCGEASTLCAEGSTGGGQYVTTGTLTQTSTGTCRQTAFGTQMLRISVTCFVTVTGTQTVLVTGTC